MENKKDKTDLVWHNREHSMDILSIVSPELAKYRELFNSQVPSVINQTDDELLDFQAALDEHQRLLDNLKSVVKTERRKRNDSRLLPQQDITAAKATLKLGPGKTTSLNKSKHDLFTKFYNDFMKLGIMSSDEAKNRANEMIKGVL